MEEIAEEILEVGSGEPDSGAEQQEAPPVAEDPYSSKASREYSQWLKGLRDSGDPIAAKFARLAKDNHGAQYALRQLEAKGIDGVRERYALLDSVVHNDPERGELKGMDAISALQDSVRSYAEIDEQLAAGDPRALESLGESFNAGLAKLAPTILDRIASSDPEAYNAAVLPHFVKALASSDLVASFNGMVDVLNEAPPSWLTAEQKTAWAADQQRKVISLAQRMGGWLNAQQAKAGEAKGAPRGAGQTAKPDPLSEREAAFNKREQESHWNTNINPKLDEHASSEFTKLFAPYAKRLNLDAATTNSVKAEFSKRVAQTAMKDDAYRGQIARYRGTKNPDAGSVLNFAKVHFDKHAKTVMDTLVNERYKPFLNGRPKAPGNTNGSGNAAPPVKGVQYVTARPAEGEIDHKSRTLDQIHKKIFPLKSGKLVQVRA